MNDVPDLAPARSQCSSQCIVVAGLHASAHSGYLVWNARAMQLTCQQHAVEMVGSVLLGLLLECEKLQKFNCYVQYTCFVLALTISSITRSMLVFSCFIIVFYYLVYFLWRVLNRVAKTVVW